jgi:hypothetical protein
MNSSKKPRMGVKSVLPGLILLQNTLVLSLGYPKKRSTDLRSPKVLWTWFLEPALVTASRYQGPLSVRITGSPT